jgi:O-antigen ligase
VLPALLSLLVGSWSRRSGRRGNAPDIAGRYALAATLITLALIASSVNSALRDAQIGLALLWISMIYLRLAQEKNDPNPWRDLLPWRRVESLTQPA